MVNNELCYKNGIVIKTGHVSSEFEVYKRMFEYASRASRTSLNVCGKVECHPGIIKWYPELSSRHQIVMESGRVTHYRLGETSVISILNDIIPALKFMHSAGIYHMDVRSSNIVAIDYDKYKLIDFGISFIADVDDSITSGAVNSWGRYPPEFNENFKNISPAVDIWMTGIYALETMFDFRWWPDKTEKYYSEMENCINNIMDYNLKKRIRYMLKRDPKLRKF